MLIPVHIFFGHCNNRVLYICNDWHTFFLWNQYDHLHQHDISTSIGFNWYNNQVLYNSGHSLPFFLVKSVWSFSLTWPNQYCSFNGCSNQVLYNSGHSLRPPCHCWALHPVQMHKVSHSKGKLFFFHSFVWLRPKLTHKVLYYCSEELNYQPMNTLHSRSILFVFVRKNV